MAEIDVVTDDGIDGPAQRWKRIAVTVLVAVVLPTLMVLLTVVRSPEFSVFDEPAHSDYLRRIEQGELPRVGDKMLEVSVSDVQCRTVQGRANAPCGLPSYEPEILDAGGYQYEAQQPPLYYVVTAGLRQLMRIGPADSFVTTARLTGAVWLSAGLLVFVAGCRRLGCRWWPTMVVTTLLAISPGLVYQSATINNDAAAALSGALALYMFAQLREQLTRRNVAIWSAVAVALVLVKPIGIVAILVAGAALVTESAMRRELDWRHFAAFAAAPFAGLATYFAWGIVRTNRATVDYDIVLEALLGFKQTDRFPLEDVAASAPRLLEAYHLKGAPISPTFVSQPALLVVIALAAAGTVWLWARRGGSAAHLVGGAALLAMLAGGPAFTVLFFLDYSVEGGPSARYGLSLLPLLGVAAAATYRTRRAMVALLILGLLVLAPLLVALAYPSTRTA